jgi:hypothetical protein
MTAWMLTDTWTITRRALLHWARQPAQVIIALLFPVLMLVMFLYLLGGGMQVPGGGDYADFLVPGLLAVSMFFGVEATMTAVSADAAKGVTDRLRSMPVAAPAILAGRSAADMLNSALGLLVLLAAGLLVGWNWDAAPGAVLAAVALLLLLRLAFVWVGIYLGLVIKSPESVAAVQILVWPLALLSSAYASPETMPGWLGAVAEWSPVSPPPPRHASCSAIPGTAAARGRSSMPSCSRSSGRWPSSRCSRRWRPGAGGRSADSVRACASSRSCSPWGSR